MEMIKKIKLAERIFRFGEMLRKKSEKLTPKLTYLEPKEKEEAIHSNIRLLPERRNYELVKKEYRISLDGALHEMDSELVRDILWAYENRLMIRSGIEETAEFNRQCPREVWDNYAGKCILKKCKTESYRTVPTFERPFLNTIVVDAIYDQSIYAPKGGTLEKYIVSSSEEELLQAHVAKIPGKFFLLDTK